MNDQENTREQLLRELEQIRRRTSALEASKTELEQTVEGLRESIRRLNLTLKSSRTGTWSLDVQEGICTWDDHCPPLFGLPPGSFGADYQGWLDLVHPDDRQRVQRERTQCLEDLTDYETEYRVIWPDGSVHVLASTSTVHTDRRVRAIEVTGLCWDVTTQTRTEEALRQARDGLEQRVQQGTGDLRKSEEEYGTLVETIPHGIQEIDTSGAITFGNAAYFTMLGYEPEELIGMYIWDLLADDLQKDQLRLYLEQLVENQPPPTPYFQTNLTQHGQPLDMQVDWNYTRDETGTLQGFVSVITDITERRMAEKKLETEGRLLRRLLDLQERERKLVAHEIHDGMVQDVVGVKMLLEGIVRDSGNDKQFRSDEIEKVRKMLVKTISEGRRLITELRPMILDEEGIIEAIKHLVVSDYSDSAFQVDLLLPMRLDRLDPMLEGTVFRIVKEALINAERHSRSTTAVVTLVQRDQQVLLEIRDHGVGFDPDAVSETNFGLRGIRERARLFGGHAAIESSPGQGCCIKVELPVVKQVQA